MPLTTTPLQAKASHNLTIKRYAPNSRQRFSDVCSSGRIIDNQNSIQNKSEERCIHRIKPCKRPRPTNNTRYFGKPVPGPDLGNPVETNEGCLAPVLLLQKINPILCIFWRIHNEAAGKFTKSRFDCSAVVWFGINCVRYSQLP